MENKSIRKEMTSSAKNIAIRIAKHYANVSCPLITYQPKMSDEVKKLKNF